MDKRTNKVRTFLELMRADNFIVVNKSLSRNIGILPSVLFYELSSKYDYFEKKGELKNFYDKKTKIHYEGYFFCTSEDLEESTSLTRREQDTAINKLIKLGLIDKQLKKLKNDGSQKRYFKIIATEELINKYLNPVTKKTNLLKNDVPNKNKYSSTETNTFSGDITNIIHENTPQSTGNTGMHKSANSNSQIRQFELTNSPTNNTNNKNKYNTKNTNNNYREISQNCNYLDSENKKPVVVGKKPNEITNLNQNSEMNPNEILELKELFQEKTKKTVSDAYIKNLLKTYGYENIFNVLNKFEKIRPANQIDNIYGFINNAVKAEYNGKPYTENASVEAIERKKNSSKPEQATNFEQREYDDEFFEGLYDNF